MFSGAFEFIIRVFVEKSIVGIFEIYLINTSSNSIRLRQLPVTINRIDWFEQQSSEKFCYSTMFMQSRITRLICKMYVRMYTIRIVIMMINVPCFPYQYQCNYIPPAYVGKQLILIEWKWCRNPYLKNCILSFPSKYLHDNYVIKKYYYKNIIRTFTKNCTHLLKSLCTHKWIL